MYPLFIVPSISMQAKKDAGDGEECREFADCRTCSCQQYTPKKGKGS